MGLEAPPDFADGAAKYFIDVADLLIVEVSVGVEGFERKAGKSGRPFVV